MSTQELLDSIPHVGRLEWIGLSPAKGAPMEVVGQARVELRTGLVGDRHAASGTGHRQVTLIQGEHFPVASALCGRDVTPELTRRNLVVTGINLLSLRDRRFRVGEVVLLGTGRCAPCGLMERNLGPGGYSAMRGHGGITASVVEPGTIRVGDAVSFLRD